MLPADHKTKYCGFENYSPKKNIINKDLAKKILGYNSRMDNMANVPGAEQTELFFLRLSEASTSAIFANETEAGNKALAALEYWAKNNALTETKQCYSSKGLSKECEKAWTQKDGQDLAPKMDSSAVQKHINHASYAYFSGLNNINSNDKHITTQREDGRCRL